MKCFCRYTSKIEVPFRENRCDLDIIFKIIAKIEIRRRVILTFWDIRWNAFKFGFHRQSSVFLLLLFCFLFLFICLFLFSYIVFFPLALFPFFLLLVVSLFLAGFCDSHISYTIYKYNKRKSLLFFYFNFHFRLLFINILTNGRCSIRRVTVNADR